MTWADRGRRAAKLLVLWTCRAAGLFLVARVLTRRRLRILCFHAASCGDEHGYMPWVFMEPSRFARRMRLIARYRLHVVGLEHGLQSLRDGTLARAETVITFDDGWQSAVCHLLPVALARGHPVTVYVTTDDVAREMEPLPLTLAYMLWATDRAELRLAGWGAEFEQSLPLGPPRRSRPSLTTARRAAWTRLRAAASLLPPVKRLELLHAVGRALDLPVERILDGRRFRLLTRDQIERFSAAGVDFQLHTHTHASPTERDAFHHEVCTNAALLHDWTGRASRHFCYPSGIVRAEYPRWLGELGVRSATTTERGLNATSANPLLLRRIVDGNHLRDVEFEACVSGFACLARGCLSPLLAGVAALDRMAPWRAGRAAERGSTAAPR